MKKIYKIYESVESNLECDYVHGDYGYGAKTLKTRIFREINDTKLDWRISSGLDEGFENIESAEKFIEENISNYETWIIVTEYRKDEK